MKGPRRRRRWLSPPLLLLSSLLVAITIAVSQLEGAQGVEEGAEGAVDLFGNVIFFVLLGTGIAGMLQVIITPDTISRWMGDDAGAMGIAVGLGAGALSPGGPYVIYPIASTLLSSGAGVGPLAGMLTSRNMITLQRMIIWDLPFLGASFSFARIIATVFMPPIAALAVPVVRRIISRQPAAPGHHRLGTLPWKRRGEAGGAPD